MLTENNFFSLFPPLKTKTGVCLLQDGNQEPFKVRLHLAKDILMIQEQDVICVSGEPFYSGVSSFYFFFKMFFTKKKGCVYVCEGPCTCFHGLVFHFILLTLSVFPCFFLWVNISNTHLRSSNKIISCTHDWSTVSLYSPLGVGWEQLNVGGMTWAVVFAGNTDTYSRALLVEELPFIVYCWGSFLWQPSTRLQGSTALTAYHVNRGGTVGQWGLYITVLTGCVRFLI